MMADRKSQLATPDVFGPFARVKSIEGSEISSVCSMSSFASTLGDDIRDVVGTISTDCTIRSSGLKEKIKEDGLDDDEVEVYFQKLPTLLRQRYHTFEDCIRKTSTSEGCMRRTLSAFDVGNSSDRVGISVDHQSARHRDDSDLDASETIVYGNKPLPGVKLAGGEIAFSFEVEVTELRDSMEDYGLAIGFTRTNPADNDACEDPYEIPHSCSVGYDGRSYQNGVPQKHDFHPGSLKVGDRVRIVVSDDRLVVSVNREDVGKPIELQRALSGKTHIWGFVGLIGSALAVRLVHKSSVINDAVDHDGMNLVDNFWSAASRVFHMS
jgi:hypothetical protein